MITKAQNSLVVVLVTAPNLETGKKIAEVLVQKRTAACVNILPGLVSFYHWEGKIQHDQEVLLLIKTKAELIEEHLVPQIQENHPYDLPEIISLPISGGERNYLNWIGAETEQKT
jgi:periplasmic divalent cation tolerance protein